MYLSSMPVIVSSRILLTPWRSEQPFYGLSHALSLRCATHKLGTYCFRFGKLLK